MIAVSSYITHTVSLPELIWTIVTGIGLYFNMCLTKEVFTDLRKLREAKINSIREFAAIGAVISELVKTFVQFALFTAGAIAMCIPAQNRATVPTFQWVLTSVFILVAFVLTGAAFLDKIRRKRLIQLIEDYGLS